MLCFGSLVPQCLEQAYVPQCLEQAANLKVVRKWWCVMCDVYDSKEGVC